MSLPDLVVVVMDCVRAWDFPGGAEPVENLPFVQQLRKESVAFPRAAAVAPWTMPSHASIFTGLYPWEHGMHGRHSMSLSDGVARLPDLLRPLGYRSACISANPLVSPTTRLATGFDFAAWGSMFEMFLRLDHRKTPPRTFPPSPAEVVQDASLRERLLRRLPYDELPLRSILERHVVLPTLAGRLMENLRDCPNDDALDVARWIEPTISTFLRAQAPDRPVMCFVNLLDAHEPYFADPDVRPDGEGWWAYARLRQDRLGWLANPTRRRGKDAELLRSLYREAIRRLDRRVGGIVEAFRRENRWRNTCFVLTSDHGQAFGESGMMYHRFKVDDAQIRIPFLARFPNGVSGGQESAAWASLVDIAPTFFEAAGTPPPVRMSGAPLQELVDRERSDPVFAISDGTLGERWIPEDRRPELDRLAAAAYLGTDKVVVMDSPYEVHAYDVAKDHRETRDLGPPSEPRLSALVSEAERILQRIGTEPRGEVSVEVSERLRAWGYV